jgi:hypothetical protein
MLCSVLTGNSRECARIAKAERQGWIDRAQSASESRGNPSVGPARQSNHPSYNVNVRSPRYLLLLA